MQEVLAAIADLAADAWPLFATALLALAFATALAGQQEKGRQRSVAQRACLDAVRDFRRLAGAAATRRALGGVTDEIRRAEDAVCEFLKTIVDNSDRFPLWQRRLVCECLVNVAGHEVFVARQLGCGDDWRNQRDFWLAVYNKFQMAEDLPPEDSAYLSQREGRFGGQEDWDGIVHDLGPLQAALRTTWWRIGERRRIRPDLSRGIRKIVSTELL